MPVIIRLWVLVAALLAASACTLGTADEMREISLNATQTAIPIAAATGAAQPSATPGKPPTPALQSIQTAANCGKLRIDVGSDPGNTLRLREQPNNSATIILLIPNNSVVTKVVASQEVAADGYTWVNIQYTDPNGVVATGWAAKDAMKDRTTLRVEGC
jgi:hypothetical protein